MKLREAPLLINGPVECRRIPPIRQKKGEWMGHGAFVGHPALVHLWTQLAETIQAVQDDNGLFIRRIHVR